MVVRPEFLKTLFISLKEKDVEFLIERNYEQLPYYTSNDIDVLVAEKDRNKFISTAINNAHHFNLSLGLNTSSYGGGRLYFFSENKIIRLDYVTKIHYRGILLLNPEIILTSRKQSGLLFIPSKGAEAAISLTVPLIYSGKVKDKYKDIIYEGVSNDSEMFIKAFKPYLSRKKVDFIMSFILRRDYDILAACRTDLLVALIRKNIFQSSFGFIRFLVNYFCRIFNLPSIFIAIIGSDGSGKSSIINSLSESIKILYPKGRFFKLHWRPGVLPQIRTLFGKSKLENEFVIANPHNQKRRSRITSSLRWMYYSLDYVIGYYLKILPMKIKTTAVVMDRYYYDIIVDPVRYGFNLPRWLLKSILPIIPKPDLTIYLDNEPEELYKRKQELPVEELERQVKAWREFIPSLPNARIVTTDKPLEKVVNEVADQVLTRRAEMTEKMLKIDLRESKYLWKSESTDYIALPSKKNCRWIIPTNPKLAKKAWDLYQPYSLRGKIYKEIMIILSGVGV